MTSNQQVTLHYKLRGGGHAGRWDEKTYSSLVLHVLENADTNSFFKNVDEGVFGVSAGTVR